MRFFAKSKEYMQYINSGKINKAKKWYISVFYGEFYRFDYPNIKKRWEKQPC